MFMNSARNRLIAAVIALGGLGLTAPAMAAPLVPDAALGRNPDGLVEVQYGHHHHGWRRHHHHGWGHRHHRHHHHWGHHHHGPRHGHHRHHRGHW